jgi:lipoprotein-anchoring transpeptidase ErfK/SrfK
VALPPNSRQIGATAVAQWSRGRPIGSIYLEIRREAVARAKVFEHFRGLKRGSDATAIGCWLRPPNNNLRGKFEATMRRPLFSAVALTLGLAATPAVALLDPLTRQPLDYDAPQQNVGVGQQQPQIQGKSPIARETISFTGRYAPGTVIVNTGERRLYYVLPGGQAIRYGIGVGREGFQWAGTQRIGQKREWPDWTPPPQMLKRRPDLPRHMKGGIDNPLGARAMYLGNTLYRIHGSNEPETIGQAVSSGCIRMANEDVIDLYERVRIGTTVVVLR